MPPVSPLPLHARAVIIGGGVVGCSILFHLAKFGWKDCVLLERDELTSGSSWHAAGQIHTISSDPNISRLQGYTINLYKEIEATSGHSVGMHNTGGFYLASNEVWHDYLKRERSKARYMGLDQEFISVEEAARRHPLIDPSHYIAALWDPLDGDVDPSGVCYAYAKSARVHGAQYFTHTPVIETRQRKDGSWDVVTPKGTINAEHVVNAAGLWAREAGRLSGLHVPVQPMEHHYLITEEIPEIAERMKSGERLPAGIDYEANIYFRQERNGMLLGTYEPKSTPWKVAGTPMDFGHELLQPDLDRIADRLELAFDRIPALGRAGIKTVVNGPFTFGPDGNPMIGPVPGMTNYWAAVGVMAGFCQAGGVGKSLAEWMIEGEPEIDVRAMDIARFGDFATPDWGTVKSSENYERRFVMTFPNETLPKGRRQKTTALHDRLVAKGAVMGVSFGLEHALWFANGPEDAHEEPTFNRNRSHDYVAAEVAAVRKAVGMIEIANFGKHLVEGPGARAWLDRMLAGRLPGPGRVALSPMLSHKGRLAGDLTVSCLAEDRFLLLGSGTAQEMHRRWFEANLPNDGVTYANVSDALHGVAISGPRSRELLARVTRMDVSPNAMKFRDARETFVCGVPVTLLRLSFSGELGIKRGALTRILDRCPSAAAIRVVTRWRIDEIALGVSDLEVWPLLRERGNAEIWLQPTLHAKYYRADDRIALGSANLTDAALGWSKSPNLEILEDMGEAYLGRAAFEASLYRNATRVDELLYRSFEVALATFPKPKITPCPTVEYETTFVDWRPVLRFPADLFAYYSGDRDLLTSAAREVAAGELLALQPPPALSEEAFNSWVRLAILQNAEFQAIDEYVVTSRRFGEMRDFLASRGAEDANRAWQTWMRWILHFLPDRLNFHTAGYSEIVSRP